MNEDGQKIPTARGSVTQINANTTLLLWIL